MEPEKLETGKALYEECATHVRYMLEWRHKLILRFFVANTSFLIIIKWLWEAKNPDFRSIIFVPFLLGTIASCAFYVMDKRSMNILKICRKVGSEIEEEIFQYKGSFAHLNIELKDTIFFSYRVMMALIYLGFAVIMLSGAIWSLICF